MRCCFPELPGGARKHPMKRKFVVFALNLLQDVNIVRPLVYMAARDVDAEVIFLVSGKFLDRDYQRTWQREISQMCEDVFGEIYIFDTPMDAYAILQHKAGILIAASE